MIPSTNAIIAATTPVSRRGAVFGFTASARLMGAFIGPLIGAGLAAIVGFRFAFAFLALILLVTAVAIIVFYSHDRLETIPDEPGSLSPES